MKSWHCGNARCFSSAISESSSFEASLGAAQVPYFFLPGAAQVLALFLENNDVDSSCCAIIFFQHIFETKKTGCCTSTLFFPAGCCTSTGFVAYIYIY